MTEHDEPAEEILVSAGDWYEPVYQAFMERRLSIDVKRLWQERPALAARLLQIETCLSEMIHGPVLLSTLMAKIRKWQEVIGEAERCSR